MIRNFNFLGDMRLDVPHLRMMESAITADFGILGGEMVAGGKPVIMRGFSIAMANAIGGSPDALSVVVAGGSVLHPTAAEAGSILTVPANRAPEVLNAANTKVVGSFVPGTNYVGLDLCRVTDPTTADLVTFVSATTGAQFVQNVPLARMLDYKFYVQTANFEASQNLLPIAIVEVDANGAVSAITDARPMFGRLGRGGTSANALTPFWTMTSRTENPIRAASGSDPDPFVGGDKTIGSLRDWMGFAETRLWELGGGEHWYSATDRDSKLVRDPTKVFSNGDNADWEAGTGNIHWKGLSVCFQGSTGWYNVITDQEGNVAGQTDLTEGECLYVDLDRTQNATVEAHKASISALGSPTVPGSRYVFAWRPMNQTGNVVIFLRDAALKVGVLTPTATTGAIGGVRLYTDPAAGDPIVAIVNGSGRVLATGLTNPGPAGGTLAIGGTFDNAITMTSANGAITIHTNGGALTAESTGGNATLQAAGGTATIASVGGASFTANAAATLDAHNNTIINLHAPNEANNNDADTVGSRNAAMALSYGSIATFGSGWHADTTDVPQFAVQAGSGVVFLRGGVVAEGSMSSYETMCTLPNDVPVATVNHHFSGVKVTSGGVYTPFVIYLASGTRNLHIGQSVSSGDVILIDAAIFKP